MIRFYAMPAGAYWSKYAVAMPLLLLLLAAEGCKPADDKPAAGLSPDLRTEKVQFDTDDPAIWYNANDPAASLILGTDKEVGGSLYVFGLDGKIRADLTVYNLDYPNNVDVEYGLRLRDGSTVDVAVTVERPKGLVRLFSVPDMQPIDGGGIAVFETETDTLMRLPMGVALYKNPTTGAIQLIVSRKKGPSGTYMWQYNLVSTDSSRVSLKLVRKFGEFSGGESEIEALMVDDELGYVYYSDEALGIRKYHADPAKGNAELAVFGQSDFAEDREGIALWPTGPGQGYIVISNQQDNSFNVYARNPEKHRHRLMANWKLSTVETDGCELLARPLGPRFPQGVFVAMSEDTTFHLYALERLKPLLTPKAR
jgi:3-phytase